MDVQEETCDLESPLISHSQEHAIESRKGFLSTDEIFEEVKKQLLLIWPLVSSNFLLFATQVISVMYVGNLGELPLAGASMATSFASVTGLSLILGMCSALDTFCGQSLNLEQDSTGCLELQHCYTCLHVGLMVYKTSLGYRGAAVANVITYWINALLLFIYYCKNTWTGFSKEAFHGISTFLKLSIPSALMTSIDMWCFEMLVLISGLLPNLKLETSVLSISLNTCAIAYMIPLAFSAAASTRVSNELGAGQPQLARLAACVALCLVIIEGIVVAAVMILGRNVWGYFYSSEKEVLNYVSDILILVAISHFVDGPQSVLSGIIRGSGQQKIGAYVNLGAYYLIGIPTGVLFAFNLHIGGKGLWLGIIVALCVQSLFLAIIVIRTDWDEEVNKASDRVNNTISTGDASQC
ncbi:hypothetical protein ACLB2K_053503 [Fragaria x ananassa]